MPFCTQCGSQVGERDIYCANCGKKQRADASSFSAPPPGPGPFTPPRTAGAGFSAPQGDPLGGITPRTASVLCYIPTVGWIAAVVVLASRRFKSDRIVRFHAFQGLYLFAAWLVVQWVIHPIMSAMPGHPLRLDHILDAILIGVWIFMLVKASHNEAYVLPIVGELAQKSALEQ